MNNIKGYTQVLLENISSQEQMELDEDLIHAVRMNRPFNVRSLLERGADPNAWMDGDTPLSWAAQKSHVKIMAALLEAGADPNIEVSRMGRSVSILAMAISLGEYSLDTVYRMMELLLGAGADPNGRDSNGRTGLAILAYNNNGDWDKYDLLFKYGADPNAQDYQGRAPLHWPFKYMTGDDRGIAKILILNGADPFKAGVEPLQVLGLFDGDLDWMPDGPIKARVKKVSRGSSMFGV